MADAAEDDARYASRPDSLRGLRACTSCCLVKTLGQFVDAFCDNCWGDWAGGDLPTSLKKADCLDLALEKTTTDYEGMVSMMRPSGSWVAKWLRMRASAVARAPRAASQSRTQSHAHPPYTPLQTRWRTARSAC